MKLIVNNRDTEIKGHDSLNVKELLAEMRYTFPMIVVKVNGTLIKKDKYEDISIKDGDKVEAIHLIGGG